MAFPFLPLDQINTNIGDPFGGGGDIFGGGSSAALTDFLNSLQGSALSGLGAAGVRFQNILQQASVEFKRQNLTEQAASIDDFLRIVRENPVIEPAASLNAPEGGFPPGSPEAIFFSGLDLINALFIADAGTATEGDERLPAGLLSGASAVLTLFGVEPGSGGFQRAIISPRPPGEDLPIPTLRFSDLPEAVDPFFATTTALPQDPTDPATGVPPGVEPVPTLDPQPISVVGRGPGLDIGLFPEQDPADVAAANTARRQRARRSSGASLITTTNLEEEGGLLGSSLLLRGRRRN